MAGGNGDGIQPSESGAGMAQLEKKRRKQLRELGVDEDTIQRLHTYDCQQFNKERQYQQRWQDEPNQIEKQIESEPSVYTVEALLDEIENMQLWEVLKKADKLTLEMLVMRMQGFSSRDISQLNWRTGTGN